MEHKVKVFGCINDYFGNANQVHTFKQACVAVYPSTVQHEIIWFWPNSDPKYKNIIETNKPPYIPELEDPSFTKLMGNRDIPYGYLLAFTSFQLCVVILR